MSRNRRPNQPGSAFHLTTRTQGEQPWFTEDVRGAIVSMLADVIRITDIALLAFAIMPNHLHLVVQQRSDLLGVFMQRFLVRVARRIQKRHALKGHIFERKYGHKACLDPEYLRNAIAYTNLNPQRAGLCADAAEYKWCSAAWYAKSVPPADPIGKLLCRPIWLFSGADSASPSMQCEAYRLHIIWRLECDRLKAAGATDFPNCPVNVLRIEERWAREFPPLFQATRDEKKASVEDLRDIARRTLVDMESRISVNELRRARGPRTHVDLRWLMIGRMAAAGHPGSSIARFFGISNSAVSQALARLAHR